MIVFQISNDDSDALLVVNSNASLKHCSGSLIKVGPL
jgi:hypothetical protein